MTRAGRAVVVALFAVFAVEVAAFVFVGRTLMDEGIFLGAARLLYTGELPYRDFPFSQGPVLLYVHGAALSLLGSSVLVGRLVSAAGALVSVGAAAAIAGRLGGQLAGALAILLSMLNLAAVWVSTTVRTQSLSMPLTMLAVLALTRTPRTALGWALAPSLLLWSTGARVMNVLAFAAVSLWVAFSLRRSPRTLLSATAIVLVQLPLAFAPLLLAPRAALDHVFLLQATRGDRFGRPMGPLEVVQDHIRSFFGAHGEYLPIVLLTFAVGVGLATLLRRGWRPLPTLPIRDVPTAQLALLVLAMLLYAPSIVLERAFFEYFVEASMVLTPAVALASADWLRLPAPGRNVVGALLAALLAVTALDAATQWQKWLGSGDSGFGNFRRVARTLGGLGGRDCTMLTFETHVAFEAGCRVLPGLEYGLFSVFPDLDDEQAEARGVLNRRTLVRRTQQQKPELIALTRLHLRWIGGIRGRREAGGAPDELAAGLGRELSESYVYWGTVPVSSGHTVTGTGFAALEVFVRSDRAYATGRPSGGEAVGREAPDAAR